MARLALTLLLLFCCFPAVAAAAPPVNTTPPQIDDTSPAVGDTLHAGGDAWDNGVTDVVYQWRRCDAAGTTCADIADATGVIYTVVPADARNRLQVRATATNLEGSASSDSAITEVVPDVLPQNTTPPGITGTPRSGQTLTAQDGTWTGTSPVVTREWLRCDAAGAACVAIPGASGQTLLLGAADEGHRIRVRETASNDAGQDSAESDPTAVVIVPVSNLARPEIAGTAKRGETLTAQDGTWAGTSPSVTRQWLRCDAGGAACAAIPGAGGQTLTLGMADEGHTIRVRETASNGAGESSAESDPTALVPVEPAQNTTKPAISGIARSGETLTAQDGAWSGSSFTVARQWLRCDASGGACSPIANATQRTLVLTSADQGHTIRLRETASNAGGDVDAQSDPTARVPTGVTNATPPVVSGSPIVGSNLVSTAGTWSGTPPFVLTRRWQRCPGDASTCADIPGRVSDTYTLEPADVGNRIRVVVRATNETGDASAASALTEPVTAASAGSGGPPPATPQPPAPAPTATPASPLTATFTGPRRSDLTRALKGRMRIRSRCSGPCRFVVRLIVSRAVARKWRVPRTVASGRRALAAPGRVVVRPRFAKTTRKRLAKVRTLSVVVVAQAKDGAGKVAAQRRWKLILTR